VPHLRIASTETPIGRLWLAGSDDGLRWIRREGFADWDDAEPDVDALADVVAQLTGYFSGAVHAFDLLLDLAGVSAFDRSVWAATARLPYGTTASYGDVAAAVGAPGAARAVGNAMARCPLTPVIPCHRVIRADGSLGGWGRDRWVKRWLLDHERSARR
jgi:methylated-DNA-[protein]-cysteine S-methyltransferase